MFVFLFIAFSVVYNVHIVCVGHVSSWLLSFSIVKTQFISIWLNVYMCVLTSICCLNFDFVGVFEVDFVIIAKLFNAKPSVFFLLIPPMYANNETNEI